MSTSLNRRTLVAGAAALPAIAIPAAAQCALAGPDPVFAAIETCRKAEAAFLARCDFEDELKEKGVELATAFDDHRTPEMVCLAEASIAARAALAETAPTTLAGLAAVLGFIREQSQSLGECFFEDGETWAFVTTIERAVLGLMGQQS